MISMRDAKASIRVARLNLAVWKEYNALVFKSSNSPRYPSAIPIISKDVGAAITIR